MTNPSTNNHSTPRSKQILPGILLGLLLGVINYGIYWVGMISTGMMTGSCSETFFNFWHVMVEIGWPIILILSAVIPAWLVFSGRRWRWFFVSLAAGVVLNLTWLLAWFLAAQVVGC